MTKIKYVIKWYFFGATYTIGEYYNKDNAKQALNEFNKTKKGAWIETIIEKQ